MNVHIDYGDTLQSMRHSGLHGTNGNAIEQTKTHRSARLGMVPRRPHSTKRIGRRPFHHGIDCRTQRARCVKCSDSAPRGNGSVGIDVGEAALWDRLKDAVDLSRSMNPLNLFTRGRRRFQPVEVNECWSL
jgi:hypothetical protein